MRQQNKKTDRDSVRARNVDKLYRQDVEETSAAVAATKRLSQEGLEEKYKIFGVSGGRLLADEE